MKNRISMMTAIVALAGMATMGMIAAQSTPPQTNPDETEVLEGRIVDIYTYVCKEKIESPARDDAPQRDRDQDRSPGRDSAASGQQGPIGLLVKDEGLIRTTSKLHIVVFDPESQTSRANYERARTMIGQNVRVSAHKFERDGVSAITLIQLGQGAQERPREERRPRDSRQQDR